MNSMNGEEASFGNKKLVKHENVWVFPDFIDSLCGVSSVKNCDLGDKDILIASYIKSGTAWLKRIVSLIRLDGDVAEADKKPLDAHVPVIEQVTMAPVLAQNEPRLMNTHLPYRLLPRTFQNGRGKIIYIARNPKDVLVSSFYFWKMIKSVRLNMTFEEFFKLTTSNDPIVPYGSWVNHVKDYWSHRDDDNFLFVKYEDLHENLEQKVLEISRFLGKELSKEKIDAIAEKSRFASMKENSSTNYEWWQTLGIADLNVSPFMRKGQIGDWKNHFTPEMSEQIEAMAEAELEPLGLRFTYE